MPALNEYTGKLLGYRQLRNHPKYVKIWNQLFTNEMGRLCQCVGQGLYGDGQHTKGTDTFFVINYKNIPRDQRKEITYTSVV